MALSIYPLIHSFIYPSIYFYIHLFIHSFFHFYRYGPNTHNLQQKLLGQADVFYQGKWFKGGGGGGTGGGGKRGGAGGGGGKGGRLFACGVKDDISEVENILSNEKKGIKKLYKDEMSLQRGNEVL